jgi:hypothetical protein
MRMLHLIQKILSGVFLKVASMGYAQNNKPNILFFWPTVRAKSFCMFPGILSTKHPD